MRRGRNSRKSIMWSVVPNAPRQSMWGWYDERAKGPVGADDMISHWKNWSLEDLIWGARVLEGPYLRSEMHDLMLRPDLKSTPHLMPERSDLGCCPKKTKRTIEQKLFASFLTRGSWSERGRLSAAAKKSEASPFVDKRRPRWRLTSLSLVWVKTHYDSLTACCEEKPTTTAEHTQSLRLQQIKRPVRKAVGEPLKTLRLRKIGNQLEGSWREPYSEGKLQWVIRLKS